MNIFITDIFDVSDSKMVSKLLKALVKFKMQILLRGLFQTTKIIDELYLNLKASYETLIANEALVCVINITPVYL